MSNPTLSRIYYDIASGELETSHGRDVPASDIQVQLMEMAIEEARAGLAEGNPPIGAVLYSTDLDMTWTAHTTNKTSGNILDHAEIKTYNGGAEKELRDNLGSCMLITTLEPCPMCTTVFTQGKIGSITVGASRNDVGGLRRRELGMHEIIVDGRINTTVYRGLFKKESLRLFNQYLAEHGGVNQHGRLFEPGGSGILSAE